MEQWIDWDIPTLDVGRMRERQDYNQALSDAYARIERLQNGMRIANGEIKKGNQLLQQKNARIQELDTELRATNLLMKELIEAGIVRKEDALKRYKRIENDITAGN